MADTYLDMQTRIADELVRSDLSSQIQAAIKSAISFYAAEHFYFNEKRAYRLTTDGTEFVALPSDFVDMIKLTLTVGDYKYPLEQRTFSYIEERNTNANWKSRPVEFALWNDQVRLYPVPDGQYQLNIAYQSELEELNADTDTNAWVKGSDAEELIRLHAKVDLLENVIRGPEALAEAARYSGREGVVLERLRAETNMRLSSNTLKPYRC